MDFDKNDIRKILRVSESPVLQHGGYGDFDEFGIYPVSPIRHGNEVLLYYGGWTRCESVPFNVAIGLAGVPASLDLVGQKDAYGRTLRVTRPATADELAAAGGLLMPKDAKCPVVLCSGLQWTPGTDSARDLIRPREEDLFL